ncbi:MAG: hypothetical protein ACFFD3_09560, partial [Candidatus Thorarchaeota archaeon]
MVGVYLMNWKHPWIPITEETQQEMLESIGKSNLEDLFQNIPAKFRFRGELNLPDSHSEIEVT